MIRRKRLPASRALLYFAIGFILSVIVNLALANAGETVDYVTYIRYTGENLTVAWDPPEPTTNTTYTALQLHHYEHKQDVPAAIAKVPQPTNRVTFSMGRWGHWVVMAKHCRPAANTGDPDECSEWAPSTDPAYAKVDGVPRAWWIYTYVAPPTGGGIE